jgi:glucose 1-dehydrogenase
MLSQEPVNGVRGRIVNISAQRGMVGRLPRPFPYSVSKGGIVQMTRQGSIDHADDLIVCNAIARRHMSTYVTGVNSMVDGGRMAG